MATFSEFFERLSPCSHVRGKEFERVVKWFLEHDSVYHGLLRRVWAWDKWPYRWGPDAGIDLVAEDYDRRTWAIQAKAYDPDNQVTRNDINKFLAESNRREIDFRLLVATTNKLSPTARRTIDKQEKRCAVFNLADLEKANIEWPASPKLIPSAKGRRREKFKPRPHQREAIRKVKEGFREADRGQLIMACGTGKTAASLWIAESLACRRVLFLVPSLSLLAQVLRVWASQTRNKFRFLAVCSDKSVGSARSAATFDSTSRPSELGYPVTISASEVAKFLRKREPGVIFCTYHSSGIVAKAYRGSSVPHLDLVIADEAHRCVGRMEDPFQEIHKPSALRARRRLFMTATPRYFTGRVKQAASAVDVEVASMDDAKVFGEVFYRLPMSEAIRKGLLVDYRVIVAGVTSTRIQKLLDQRVLVEVDQIGANPADYIAGQIVLAKGIKKYGLKRVITFHSRIRRAKQFGLDLPKVSKYLERSERPRETIWSRHITGEMSAGERAVVLSDFGDTPPGRGPSVLTNARCLSEGIDIPTLDAIGFMDPRRSQIDVIQAVGRAIRLADEKELGTIVVPVVVPATGEFESYLDSSAYRTIWQVLRALRAHDDRLAEALDLLRTRLGRAGTGRPRLPKQLVLDLPQGVDVEFMNAIVVRAIEQSTSSWEFYFGLLEEFVEREGHSRVPAAHVENDEKLGQWVKEQRKHYKGKGILAERVQRLEEMPSWVWNEREAFWMDSYEKVAAFARENGHLAISDKSPKSWLEHQRSCARAGTMQSDREVLLGKLPGWSTNPSEAKWTQGYEHLRRFLKEHGHCAVPQDHRPNGYNLGTWVANQRQFYRKGKLTPERTHMLDKLRGWKWQVKRSHLDRE